MIDLKGATAFITGAAGGIGLGIARAMAAEGMKLAIADVDAEVLEESAQGLRELGAEVMPVALDVRDRDGWGRAVAAVNARFGAIRVLCNNAGVTTYDPLADMPEENWDWIMAVNVTGVYNGIRAVVPGMIDARAGGQVVNTASEAGLFPMKGYSIGAYAASKAAVVTMSEALRLELAPHGIGVSAFCPGLVETRIGMTAARLRPVEAKMARPAVLANTVNRGGADPDWVGERVVAGIKADQPYIFTHSDFRSPFEERVAAIRAEGDKVIPPRIL